MRGAIAPLAALVGCLLATGAYVATASGSNEQASPGSPQRVLLIGDSVSARIYQLPAAAYELEHGLSLTADVAVCRRLVAPSCTHENVRPRTVAALVQALPRVPTVVVVDVGANESPASFAGDSAEVTRLLTARGARHVVWVTLTESRPSFRAINDSLRALARKQPAVVRIADWGALSRGRDWLEGDRVHLSTAGAIAHARVIRAAVMAVCGQGCVVPPRPPLQPRTPGKPVCTERAGGKWASILATAPTAREALATQRRAIANGFTQSVIVQATPTVWEIVLFGFPNRRAAIGVYLDARARGFRSTPVPNVDTCDEASGNWSVVFGHSTSDTAARALLGRVRASGYTEASIDSDGTSYYEVTLADAVASTDEFERLSAGALRAGWVVSYEPS